MTDLKVLTFKLPEAEDVPADLHALAEEVKGMGATVVALVMYGDHVTVRAYGMHAPLGTLARHLETLGYIGLAQHIVALGMRGDGQDDESSP